MKKRALFIGRFQPVHLGHVDAIKQIFAHPEKFEEVIIAIGSAEDDFLPENPFTASERAEMLALALEESDIYRNQYWVVPVRNINRYSLWPEHVAKLCPSFEAIFSGSSLVRTLWEESPLQQISIFEIKKNLPISATAVREKIQQGAALQKMVPLSVEKYLKKIGAAKRLQNI